MSVGVKTREVKDDEGELRLDRWFKRHFPLLQHGHLEKLLRTGQIRVDGKRAKANLRLARRAVDPHPARRGRGRAQIDAQPRSTMPIANSCRA